MNEFTENLISYNSRLGNIDALIRIPTTAGLKKAVIIIHTGNGWGKGMSSFSAENITIPYAKFLASNGFVTLEPRFFLDRNNRNEYRDLPLCFDALDYLSSSEFIDKDNISIMGFSYGGFLSFAAATKWAVDSYRHPGTEFRSCIPFYPICWILIDHIRRSGGYPDFPSNIFDEWNNTPMAIFQGGKDYYEDLDSDILNKLINCIPCEAQRSITKGFFYPEASHGWDRGYDYTFEDPHSRKGTGGTNTNTYNKEVTIQARQDLLDFLNSKSLAEEQGYSRSLY